MQRVGSSAKEEKIRPASVDAGKKEMIDCPENLPAAIDCDCIYLLLAM